MLKLGVTTEILTAWLLAILVDLVIDTLAFNLLSGLLEKSKEQCAQLQVRPLVVCFQAVKQTKLRIKAVHQLYYLKAPFVFCPMRYLTVNFI